MIHNDRQNVFWNPSNIAVDHNLFEILGFDEDLIWGSLSWTGQLLFRELHGRTNLGQGALKTEGIDIKTFYIFNLDDEEIKKSIRLSRERLSKRIIGTVFEESSTVDRRDMDNIFFDLLNLNLDEREEVYDAVIHLVKARLGKADSLNPKERRKRLAAVEKTGGIWAGLPEEEDNGE